MKKFNVIFHIDESEKWTLVLANVKNLISELGEDQVSVIVLSNSVAVSEYVTNIYNSSLIEKMNDLSEKGVSFKACRNALASYNIDKQTLVSYVEIVPAGVAELVKRQAEGYGYIKP